MPDPGVDPLTEPPRYRQWDLWLVSIANIIDQWRHGDIPDINAVRAIVALVADREDETDDA